MAINTTWVMLAGALVLSLLLVSLLKRLAVVARPDEWLLQIRNGRLMRSGVGIYLLRLPGDVVARFTATMQRVRFGAEALTTERLLVAIEGYLLWSVAKRGDMPFQAFSKLGIVNLADRHELQGSNRKHLLTRPQHHAFQQMLAAAVQRHAASFRLEQLLGDPDAFVSGLRTRLSDATQQMGVQIEDVQILQIRPTDPEVLERLGAGSSEEIREQASHVVLETDERIRRREIESSAALANEEVNARREEEIHQAQTTNVSLVARNVMLSCQHGFPSPQRVAGMLSPVSFPHDASIS